MTEQMTDTALRQQVAQWTRAALGNLVEDEGAQGRASQTVGAIGAYH